MKKGLLISMLFCATTAFSQDIPRYFGQTAESYQSQQAYGNHHKVGNYVNVAGTQIYYETYGQGEPLVILHGGLVGSIGEMGQFIDHLAPYYQVIAINTRGHGKSEMGKETLSYERKAEDVKAVLEALRIQVPIRLVGFSDGAYTGYYFAARYPEKIQKLVAIGAGSWQKAWRPFSMPFADFIAFDPAYWQEQITHIRPNSEKTEQWLKAQTAYYDQVEVGQSLFEQVKTHTLILAGENDTNAPLDTVIQAYKWLPNADLAIIPNAPHSVFLSHFPAVWTAITPFLQIDEKNSLNYAK